MFGILASIVISTIYYFELLVSCSVDGYYYFISSRFGYPYADYLPQVKIELAAKGIYSEVEANQQRRTWKPNKTL